MDKTPEKQSFKIGTDRIALLTGTFKRQSPYPDASQRKRRAGGTSRNESFDSLSDLPATRAVLAAMRSTPIPAAPSGNNSFGMTGINVQTSIKRAAIDWKLANKEAEVFKLKTDIQKLESLLTGRSQNEEKLRIEYDKELAKAEVERQCLTTKIRRLEQEAEAHKNEIAALKETESQLQTAFLPEKEELEKKIIELKMNDYELRAKFLDAEEELKSAKLTYDRERLNAQHEIRCLKLELESLRTQKQLLDQSNRSLKNELSEMMDLKAENDRLQAQIQSLSSTLKNQEESVQLRRLFQDDMNELKRLQEENRELKQSLESALAVTAQPEPAAAVVAEAADAEADVEEEEEENEAESLMTEDDGDSMSESSGPLQIHDATREEDVEQESDDDDRDDGSPVQMGAEESDEEENIDDDDDSDIAEVSSD